MTTESHINQLFNNLDAWRHLPAYQLERRADIFFSIYLPIVLKTRFCLKHEPVLIPEFPCRIGSVHGGESNQSFKIDYLALCKNDNQAFFVELKTDSNSVNMGQLSNMQLACAAGLGKLMSGLVAIAQASVEKTKYKELATLTKQFANWDVEPKIVYLLPTEDEKLTAASVPQITFADFADAAEQHPDYLSLRFAKSLREWAKYEAGNPKPKAVNE